MQLLVSFHQSGFRLFFGISMWHTKHWSTASRSVELKQNSARFMSTVCSVICCMLDCAQICFKSLFPVWDRFRYWIVKYVSACATLLLLFMPARRSVETEQVQMNIKQIGIPLRDMHLVWILVMETPCKHKRTPCSSLCSWSSLY